MTEEYPAEEITAELKQIAPDIVFSVSWANDPYCSWDGDGPSPREEGFNPYDVDFKATAIANGDFVEGEASLGSCWYKPDQLDPDVGGYLVQKLEEAADELFKKVNPVSVRNRLTLISQLTLVRDYLKVVSKARYDEQRRELECKK